MKIFLALFTMLCSFGVLASDLPTEMKVDVSRYVGKWYAHYSLPQFFTRNCVAQTAEYEVIDEVTISVLNTCLKKNGFKIIEGKAVVSNPGDNSKLVVTFDNFFTRLFRVKGDYNIIKLDKKYDYVLVGSEDRESLWLMSRSKEEIPQDIKDSYFKIAEELGFQTKQMQKSQFDYL